MKTSPYWFIAASLLGSFAVVRAAPKTPAKSAAPASLGNGIYVLGDDGGSAPLPSYRSKTATPVKRTSAVQKPLAKTDLNRNLVRFCRSYLGYKLGNGQCSELAMIGLPAIGAQCDLSRQWGQRVCDYGAANGRQFIQLGEVGRVLKGPRRVDVRPGDLIQYEGVKFERHWSDGRYEVHEYPHHTSVIESVSRDGRTYKVLEQNVNNTQFMLETTLHLADLTGGVMHITRPTPRF